MFTVLLMINPLLFLKKILSLVPHFPSLQDVSSVVEILFSLWVDLLGGEGPISQYSFLPMYPLAQERFPSVLYAPLCPLTEYGAGFGFPNPLVDGRYGGRATHPPLLVLGSLYCCGGALCSPCVSTFLCFGFGLFRALRNSSFIF
mgnify:CR=1 FL=1